MSSQRLSRNEFAPPWMALMLVAGLWLLARPYLGLRHDGVLYMGQTLLHLNPVAMKQDLFFLYGSQDQFSIFSKILALLYDRIGLAQTQRLFLLCGQLPFLIGSAWLIKDIEPPLVRYLGLAAMASMSHFYGGIGIFAFGETFVTARTVAEPMVILALIACANRSFILAFCLGIIAALAHPLVALPFFVVEWIFLCQIDRRWLWAAPLALLALSGLGFIAPKLDAWQTFDEAWFELVKEGSPHVLVGQWQLVDWAVVAMDVTILRVAALMLPASLALLCRSILIATLLLLTFTSLFGDIFKSVLLTGLQTWRVLWIAHLVSLLCMPALILRLRGPRQGSTAVALAWALSVLAIDALWPTAWAFAIWAGLLHWASLREGGLTAQSARAATLASCLAIVGVSFSTALSNINSLQAVSAPLSLGLIIWVLIKLPPVSLPVTAFILRRWQAGQAIVGTVVCLIIAVTGASLWDRRTDWIRYIETAKLGVHPFSRLIPISAQVYWPNELAATWAVIGRPSFFSNHQGAGLLFNRDTAIEFSSRRPATAPLSMQQELCSIISTLNSADSKGECVADSELITDMCNARPSPDYLILPFKSGAGVIAQWEFHSADRKKVFSLYDCGLLRH